MKSKLQVLTGALILTSCAIQVTPNPQSPHKVLGTLSLTVGEEAGITGQTFTVLNKSVQLKNLGTKYVDANGYRYISTTYSVRNAQSNGVAYTSPKSNITLLAYLANGNLQNTAVRKLVKADGTAANPTLALQVKPSAGITDAPTSPTLAQQSFQAFNQNDVDSLLSDPTVQGYGITHFFPYGFVVEKTDGSRTLAGNPTVNQYDGKVTLAVKVPLQNPVSDTPKTVTLTTLVVEDQTTQVTESLEEQQLGSTVGARKTASGSTQVNVFRGSTYSGSDRQTLCKIPLSTGSIPAYLVNDPNTVTITPDASTLAQPDSSVQANLEGCDDFYALLSASNPENQLVIQAFQTGKRLTNFNAYNAGTFTETGSAWNYVGAAFKPGEEVEVTVVNASDVIGRTQRFRIATSPEGVAGFGALKQTAFFESAASGVALGDFNGDRRLDALVGVNSGNLHVLLGNGNGTFQSPVPHGLAGNNPRAVKLGDVNNDGRLDVLVPDGSTATLSVLMGNGDGTFQTVVPVAAPRGSDLGLGDLNQDGNLDLAIPVIDGSHTAAVLLGNGDGTFQIAQSYPVGDTPRGLALTDVNADGQLDLLVTNGQGRTLSVLLGNGDGTMQTQVTYPTGITPIGVASGDFNGDGNPDVAVGNYDSSSVSILLGNGDGTFQPRVDFSGGGGRIQLGDFNGDGFLDVSTTTNNTVVLLQGQGDGTFQSATAQGTGLMQMTDLAAGDLDGDGRLDLAATGNAFNSSTENIDGKLVSRLKQ